MIVRYFLKVVREELTKRLEFNNYDSLAEALDIPYQTMC
jgi:hypothetical protein